MKNQNNEFSVYLIAYIQRSNGTDTAFHRMYFLFNTQRKRDIM